MFLGLQKEKNDSKSFLIRQKYYYKFGEKKKKRGGDSKTTHRCYLGWLGQHKFDDGGRATSKKRVSPISFGDGSSTGHYS